MGREEKRQLILDPAWRPVPEIPVASEKWTDAAINCYEINRECQRCDIYKLFNRRWVGIDSLKAHQEPKKGVLPCFMPGAVQYLLNKVGLPSEDNIRVSHTNYTSHQKPKTP